MPHPSSWPADWVEWIWSTFCWNMVLMSMQDARYKICMVAWGLGDVQRAISQQIHTLSPLQNGITAVHVACQEGHLDIVKVLESHGAALDAVSEVRVWGFSMYRELRMLYSQFWLSRCKFGPTPVLHYRMDAAA